MHMLRFFLEDWRTKLVAVLIALFLWFHSATEKYYEAERNIQIIYIDIPENLIFRKEPEKYLKAKFSAKGKDLIKLFFTPPRVFINLKNTRAGKLIFKLSPGDIIIPEKIKAIPVSLQEKVVLYLDEIMEKTVPINLNFSGKPRKGYTVQSVEPEHKEVVITGPESIVKKIGEIKTEDIVLTGKKSSFFEYSALLSPSKFVNVFPESVRVFIKIEEEKEKIFEYVEYTLIAPLSMDIEHEPENLKIKIRGGKTRIESFEKSRIRAIVNVAGMGEGEYYIQPHVSIPESIEIIEVEPEYVKVILKNKGEREK